MFTSARTNRVTVRRTAAGLCLAALMSLALAAPAAMADQYGDCKTAPDCCDSCCTNNNADPCSENTPAPGSCSTLPSSCQPPSAQRTMVAGQVIAMTGRLSVTAADLGTPLMSHTYVNQIGENPNSFSGDMGNNHVTTNQMRIVAAGGGDPPSSVIVCYNVNFERRFNRVDSTNDYVPADPDVSDTLTYGANGWVLKKCCGPTYYFHSLNAASAPGGLSQTASSCGVTTTYTYDANSRVVGITNSVVSVTITYSTAAGQDNMIHTITSSDGKVVYCGYDKCGNMARLTFVNNGVQQTTMFVYGDGPTSHDLLCVVGPQEYQQMRLDCVHTVQSGHPLLCNENPAADVAFYQADPATATIPHIWADYADRQYTYDANNRVYTITAAGHVLTLTYSSPVGDSDLPAELRSTSVVSNVVTVTGAGQPTTKTAVDLLGRLRYRQSSVDAEIEKLQVDYDASGRVTACCHPDDSQKPTNLSVYYTDYTIAGGPSGEETTYPAWRVVKYVDGENTVRSVKAHYTYGVEGFPGLPKAKTTYLNGTDADLEGAEGGVKFTTNYYYNTDGTVQYAVQPLVKSGLLPGQTAPKDYRLGVEYTYSAAFPGQVASETRFICDSFTDCEGSEPTIQGRVDQTTTRYDYYDAGPAKGLLSRTTVDYGDGKLNLTTEYQYDQYRHPSATVVDPAHLGLITQYVYSQLGNLLNTTSPGGYYTTNTYDLSNRLTATSRYQDSSQSVQLSKTEYDYDTIGRMTNTRRWWNANSYAESFSVYDETTGRLTDQVDAPDGSGARHGRHFTYDNWGNVTQVAVGGVWDSNDENGSWSTSLDVVAQTDYVENYQAEGLTGAAKDGYDDGVTQNTYDGLGRLATVTQQKKDVDYGQGGGTLRTTLFSNYTYDNRNQVTKTENWTASGGAKLDEVTTVYDSLGRVVTSTVCDGNGHTLTTAYDYDAQGRVWQVTDSSGNKSVTLYDAAGRTIRQTDGYGDIVETTYDDAGRIAATVRKDHEPGAGTLDADYLWYVTAFAYDSEGRTTKATDQGEDVDYDGVGDAASPLVTQTTYSEEAFKSYVTVMDPLSHYTTTGYDGLGRRRCSQEGGVEVSGALQYATETRFDYEQTGRLQAMVSGGADGLVDPPNDADNQTTSYAYDTHGRLATTTYPDGHSVYDTWHIHNGALQCVVDQDSTESTYTYKALDLGGQYGIETRQYVSAGSPLGDREIVTITDGPGRLVNGVANATPGGTQTSQVTNCYEYWARWAGKSNSSTPPAPFSGSATISTRLAGRRGRIGHTFRANSSTILSRTAISMD